MIDWCRVGADGVWVIGLALVLSSISFHRWARQTTRDYGPFDARRLTQRGDWHAGWFLTAIGFACLPDAALWERLGWWILASVTAWVGWSAWEARGRVERP